MIENFKQLHARMEAMGHEWHKAADLNTSMEGKKGTEIASSAFLTCAAMLGETIAACASQTQPEASQDRQSWRSAAAQGLRTKAESLRGQATQQARQSFHHTSP